VAKAGGRMRAQRLHADSRRGIVDTMTNSSQPDHDTGRVNLPFLAGFLLIALSMLLIGCSSAVKKPTITLADIRIAEMTRDTLGLTVGLKVDNPNAVELTLSNIRADLFLADAPIGKAESMQSRVTLPPSGSVTLPLRLNLELKTLPEAVRRSVINMAAGGGVPYRVNGSVTTFNGLLDIPFNHTGSLGWRR